MAVNQIIGGGFKDLLQNKIASGYLKFELKQSVASTGYLFETLSSVTPIVVTGLTYYIPLDVNGNIVTSPTTYSLYPNDILTPDSYYLVSCYNSNGQLVWGPNAQKILSSPSPFDIGVWIPNQI